MKNTLVKNSPIHGKGLFASTFIKKDTILGYLKGQPTTKDGMYVLWISETDAIKVEGDLKYINHSATPNACYYDDLSVVTLCDISKGDEITHDYGGDWS